MDTTNKFAVAVQNDRIVTLLPVPRSLSKDDALILAAWLVALSETSGEKFMTLLEEIWNT